MAQIEQYTEQIKTFIEQYEKLIYKSPLYNSDRKKWKQMCSQKQKKIKNLMLQLKEQIDQLPSSSTSNYVGTYKNFQSQFAKLQTEVKNKLRNIVKAQNNSQQKPEQFDKDRDVKVVMQKGDEAVSRIRDAISSMNVTVQEGIQLAQTINLQLNKQIQQLDRMRDKVKDTDSALRKAQKTINYFVKAAQCDKCLLGLIICIILALITLIILIVKKNG